jgi:MraZ protein
LLFHGTFDHTLDSKNRLMLPARYREALRGGVFLVRSPDSCLRLYKQEEYAAVVAQSLEGLDPLDPETMRRKRRAHALAEEIQLDAAGRIVLSAKLLKHAGISGPQVKIVGAGEALEFWDPAIWDEYEARELLGDHS